MSQEYNIKLTRKVTVRFSEHEYKRVNAAFKTSTKRKLSEYIRAMLLHRPVTFYTRSQSVDDFVAELILLRRELNALGNNFNQSVKKLHTLEHIEDIKTWAIINENGRQLIFKKMDEIEASITQIARKWSQE